MVYPGSKNRLSPYFVPLLQKIIERYNIDTYIEPFVGGANIFDKIKCKNKFAYDRSRTLISLFNQGLNDASVIPAHGSREWWNEAKAQYKGEKPRTMPDWEIGAIQFFASFGTRGFPGGYANNKNGKDYYNERYRNFIEQLGTLHRTGGTFDCKSYQNIEIPDKSLVYCDPPYEGTKPYGYSFENEFNHQEYWNWVRKISKKNYVVCSEQQCPEDFDIIWSGELTRMVSANNDYKGSEIHVNTLYALQRDNKEVCCTKCRGEKKRISQYEARVKTMLDHLQIHYTREYRVFDCKNPITNVALSFDFYLPDYNAFIEVNGSQHFYNWTLSSDTLSYRIYKDVIKAEYCKSNGYKLISINSNSLEYLNQEKLFQLIIK